MTEQHFPQQELDTTVFNDVLNQAMQLHLSVHDGEKFSSISVAHDNTKTVFYSENDFEMRRFVIDLTVAGGGVLIRDERFMMSQDGPEGSVSAYWLATPASSMVAYNQPAVVIGDTFKDLGAYDGNATLDIVRRGQTMTNNTALDFMQTLSDINAEHIAAVAAAADTYEQPKTQKWFRRIGNSAVGSKRIA